MEDKQTARDELVRFLTARRLKKTSERLAVLEAAYAMDGMFSINQLDHLLAERYIKVSKATLYSALKICIQARLIIRHNLPQGTFYEKDCATTSRCRQVCTVCGKSSEFTSPEIAAAVEATKLRRFRQDGFTLYVYGVCSVCQTRLSRQLNMENRKKNK